MIASRRRDPANVGFADLEKVCDDRLGEPLPRGGSHSVDRMPRQGDPRVNIHDDDGKAKAYQVKQAARQVGGTMNTALDTPDVRHYT